MTDAKKPKIMSSNDWKPIAASQVARNTTNPIRDLVDGMDLTGHPDKAMIPLSIGDPTVFGNIVPDAVMHEAIFEATRSDKYNGYPHSTGYKESREAVGQKYSQGLARYSPEDVVLTSGCSGALQLAMLVLANPGANVLIPQPGFSLYKTLADANGIETRGYRLLPEKQWQADVEQLESLIDDKTAAIIINNPSNPCGSVFPKENLQAILQAAARKQVPIISDEVYADMAFSNSTFYSAAELSDHVPVLTCGGIAKRYCVPGWRLGWVLVHDPCDAFKDEVRLGLTKLSQHILGANSLVQAALPTILAKTPDTFYEKIMSHLENNATFVFDKLSAVDGLKPVMPQGSMYLMVQVEVEKFRDIKDDRDFTQKLLKEESVFCLPAVVFGSPNFFRIVTTIPKERMEIAVARIADFCKNHRSV